VVVFHGGQQTWLAKLSPAFRAGPVMVPFFFVLSGFIMTIAYDKGDGIDKGKYWAARFARIAPVYFLALALTLLTFYVKGKKIDFIPLTFHVFFLQAWVPRQALSLNVPAWSLSMEMFFYLTFPFSLALLKRNSVFKSSTFVLAFWIFSMTILSAMYYSSYYQKNTNENLFHAIIFYFPVSHLSSFLLGVAGGLIYNNYLSRLQVAPAISARLVLAAFSASFLSLHYGSQIKSLLVIPRLSFAYGFASPLFLLIILSLSIDRSFFSRILANKILVFLGELGYSIYILQYPIRNLYARYIISLLNITGSHHFYLYLLLLIVLSAIIYTNIENPVRYSLRKAANGLFVKLQSRTSEQI
ncbi:MAG: acyltransferase, partial [Anaerolineaceae bacterium]